MLLINNFPQIVKHIVLEPSMASVFALFGTSLINEFFGIVPYATILSGNMIFLNTPVSLSLISKLFIFVAIPVSLGAAIGSLFVYALAYWGGKPAIERFGKYVHLSWHSVEKVQSKFKGTWYDEVIFLVLRSIPFMPGLPVAASAGIFRMNFVTYFTFTAFGSIIKVMFLCTLVALSASAVGL